jgi:hypothetical protein
VATNNLSDVSTPIQGANEVRAQALTVSIEAAKARQFGVQFADGHREIVDGFRQALQLRAGDGATLRSGVRYEDRPSGIPSFIADLAHLADLVWICETATDVVTPSNKWAIVKIVR